ncbi:acetolactate decarboxylase [Sphingobacterium bambusae]|uniref:Alpha-acetolactate decarboxylase n=1 Tax=Sphingobacterium bambusae TaxID=662858 RepID=A0ABW6BD24_9SPHI|nr:acetolactate decarboxylase [Sphingobacterium bambusae]WPL48650.1 acetolactate decarboxylase [Sphingobacterium bambusae]
MVNHRKKWDLVHYGFLFLLLAGNTAYLQQIIHGFSMPESVTSDGNRFFVSNQGQDVFAKDGDGFISLLSEDGKVMERQFLPKEGVLNAPKGMHIAGNILYVADLDRIVGFDIASRETVFELRIPEASMLNDICGLETGFIAVTETASGNIYKINTESKQLELMGNIPTANGIAYNRSTGQLVVSSNGIPYGAGSIYVKSAGSRFKELPNIAHGFFDGIAFTDDTHLLISDWVSFPLKGFGKLWTYDLETQRAAFQFVEESVADIYYDQATKKLWMPHMFQNKVLIHSVTEVFKPVHERANILYNYGVIDAFIGGLYRGTLPVHELLLKGDFGLGAPDMLDGELTMLDGKAYQTIASGATSVLDREHKTSFAAATFFHADTVFHIDGRMEQKDLLAYIAERLPHKKSALYVIKVSGKFEWVKTRAFPPVTAAPFPALTTIMDRQRFFEHQYTTGACVGYYLPEYLSGINVGGFHLHYLSADKTQGGHILDLSGENLYIEIAYLKRMELDLPIDADFENFQFKERVHEDLKRVEQGR